MRARRRAAGSTGWCVGFWSTTTTARPSRRPSSRWWTAVRRASRATRASSCPVSRRASTARCGCSHRRCARAPSATRLSRLSSRETTFHLPPPYTGCPVVADDVPAVYAGGDASLRCALHRVGAPDPLGLDARRRSIRHRRPRAHEVGVRTGVRARRAVQYPGRYAATHAGGCPCASRPAPWTPLRVSSGETGTPER